MEQADWFEEWFSSPYYKILYQNRDESEAKQFVESLLEHLQPPKGSKMLDIACGEGRYSVILEEHGNDVIGIDLSHESIEVAKSYENEHLHFYVHDMRLPLHINYFDYSFNFFTSFGYFAHDRDNVLAAKSFAKGLKKDGILVVDYLNRDFVINNMLPEDTIHRGSYAFNIKKRIERNHIIKEISFLDADNNPKKFREEVAAFSLSEFEQIFEKANLKLVQTFGDYQLNEFDPMKSPRLIMMFKK